jgi:hypothetical protein
MSEQTGATLEEGAGASYIGVSAEQFLKYAEADLKEADATALPGEVRESYSRFVGSLQNEAARVRPQYYVFVFSRFIIVKVSF